ncbi:MAG: hypothetical protein N2554_03305, partial [Fimbriimonadales bacterium]|nr:hypothetical protein [Fimbriimonadales bacterium]
MRQKALIGGVCALTILISVRAAAEDDLQIKLKPVLAEAVQTVKTFKSPEARAILLAKIVRIMARAGMHDEARVHLQLAYQAFQQTEVGNAREQLKPALALAYAEIGSHDKAIELLKPLSLRERVSTYQQIVWSLA